MGYRKLCVLLLLSCSTLAQERQDSNEETPVCQLASTFKAFRKYVYQYSTESRNSVTGAPGLNNGPMLTCQVEIEVPHMCKFIMHTRGCTLSEVSFTGPSGQPVYRSAPRSDTFQDAMEKNPLKFTFHGVTSIQLYPEADELANILNIKRGIVSALMVPHTEDGQNSRMSTVHGHCVTHHLVNSSSDSATGVTLIRDLSHCDHFYSRELTNSPLALLQKLHSPMSKLITSTQSCSYQFDNRERHITTASCTETHTYLPPSHQDNAVSSVVTQELRFQSSRRISSTAFSVERDQVKPLHFQDPEDKSPVQTQDDVLSTLRELVALAGTDQGQKRAGLFHKLVSGLRVLRNKTLSRAVPEMRAISGWLTWQALFQCGTSECTSAVLQIIRTIDGVSLETDALVYALSLQTDPDAARVRDMLSMAQYKQSKAIMYALANTVKKFHKRVVTPEVTDVSKFMEMLLNDCSGENQHYDSNFPPDPAETSFLVLRVVGVMGQAMQAVSPSLIASILRCAKKTDIPLSHQKAAIQAFRQMEVNDEVKDVLMEVYRDTQNPVEKRLAAFLILMKSSDPATARDVIHSLENERDEQVRIFVVSYLNNIRNSDEPQMKSLREYIELALNGQLSPTGTVFDGMSRNYKMASSLGSIQSNIIFDGRDTLPKEMMLETTLKVFDYSHDIFEVGVEGAGFEPTIDAFFGERGFFPESISRLMYLAQDKAPILKSILDRIAPQQNRMKRQVPEDFLKAIADSVQKLMNEMSTSPAPEATAYLRLLGNEIGYLKTSEMRKMLEILYMYYHNFISVLPSQAFFQLTSRTDNEVFAHYIFMENAFALPTASGLPLKFSLAGVFTPGARGGLTPSAVTDLSFMPSVGLEFITQMGVHIPDYLDAGIRMHTNMYHESSLNAKVTVDRKQIRLSISAPKSNTQLFSVSHKLLSLSSGQTTIVPCMIEAPTDSADCQPLFSGLKLCTIVRDSNAISVDEALCSPLVGETRFAVEIQPTGTVSEYTATITDEALREGKRGRHRVETLKLTLRAEGDDSSEASASLKYNHLKNSVSAEVVVPDYDVEAGVKLALTESGADRKKMRGITIDVTNKNIPQLTLVGRARLSMMKDAMLQLQLVIPSLRTDASVTANLNKNEDVIMDLETIVHLSETSYQQKASLKYDNDKFEVELKSDLNSEIQKMIPNAENHRRQLQQLIDDILEQRVAKTDMKLRHIVTKGIEAGYIWLDKLTVRFPALAKLRNKRSLSDLTLPALPEKLFVQFDSLFRYQFNKDKMAVSLPLPLGGKKSEELNIPNALSVPLIDVPQIGLYIPPRVYPLPRFTIPPSLDLSLPLLGLAEASTKINSNFYSWEGSLSGGNNTADVPSYTAQYKAMAHSPFSLLSYKLEGTGMMSGRPDDNLKYLLNSSFSHSLIDASFSVLETLRVTNKLSARANYKMEASSPLGLQANLYYSARATSALNSDEVSGDGTVNGLLKIGSFQANTTYVQSYNLRPLDRVGRGESTLQFDSPVLQVHNMIRGVYANSELNIMSKTSAQKDMLQHVAELRYKDTQLTLKCSTFAKVVGESLNNQVEFGISGQMALLRIESQAYDDKNRVYSLISGLLDTNGLEVNSEGSLTFETGRVWHKASVTAGRNGLITSGTNSIHCSPVIIENVFICAMDRGGASLSSTTKVMGEEVGRGELKIEGKITAVEASLYGDLKGNVYDATTASSMNIILNRRALTFTGNTKGSLRQMKTQNSHTLTLTLWTLSLRSKSDNLICEDIYYKQNTRVDVKPFVMRFNMTNNLRFYDITLNNEGHVRLEPVKVELGGNMNGAYREKHNFKHTYELTYASPMAGTMKYSTSGSVMDAQLSHSCELEFAGLSSTSNCKAQLNSEAVRFNSTVRTMVLPFSLNVDAGFNGEGDIKLRGNHVGHVYNQLLLKAEPLALSFAHNSGMSTAHKFPSGESSISLKNKFEGLLTPSDQFLTWEVNSKMNDHAYNQEISISNSPVSSELAVSAIMLEDVLNLREMTKFNVSGFLQYDKNSDCHIIKMPFIESFPAAFEQLKNTLVQTLDSLQQVIHDLHINQLISDFREKLEQLPVQVSNFMRELDLENKVNKVKAKIDDWINASGVTMKDLELAVNNLRKNLETTVMGIVTKTQDLIFTVEEYIKDGHLEVQITNVLSDAGNHLWAFDNKYKIKQSLVKVLDIIEDIIKQIDFQKLRISSAAFLQELDSKYEILETIKAKLSEIKRVIQDFNVKLIFEDLKQYLLSVDWATYVEQLSYNVLSSEIAKVMESMHDVIVNWIDEYEISIKFNEVYFYIRDLILKYELDDIVKQLMDQVVILVEQFKIEKTVQSLVDAVKSVKFEHIYDKMMQFLSSVTNQLRAIDFKKSIDDLNEYISLTLKSMKTFRYSAFVDETNEKIAELTDYVNEQIKTYELVKKTEALRDFFREIQTSVFMYLDELKNTKVADALKKLKNVIDTTFYNDIKLKVQDILEDARQRILDMDIRGEMYLYLERASESYRNIIELISVKFSRVMEQIVKTAKDNEILNQMKQVIDELLSILKRGEFEVPTFTVPLTDLVIPGFIIDLKNLQDISIPVQISLPQFTILNSYTIPGFTIDIDEIKAKIIALIDEIRDFEIQAPDPEEIFGDLKVLYLSELPDLTFPEITLSEIKFPAINIPKLELRGFEVLTPPIPEIRYPRIPSDICIPRFGKLHGEFRVYSPHITLVTTGKIENSTSTLKNPQFTATITSHANSRFKPLEYTIEATARLEAPRMKKLQFTEMVKVSHMVFSIDHIGSLTLTGTSVEASAETIAKATTQMYAADLVSKMDLTLKSGIRAAIDTTYNHSLDIPSLETSSQASVKQNLAATVESGKITVTGETTGNGKWLIHDYSDEGMHKSNMEFDLNFSTAKLTFTGETDTKALKAKQTLTAESEILNRISIEATCETILPSVKKSVLVLDGVADIGDLKVALTAFHNAEFTGNLTGSMSNSLEFMTHPFEMVIDVKNKVNSKIFFPLKLTGKVDLQHDYGVVLNSEKQQASCFALARFNQYKYSHNFTVENNEMDVFLHSSANGEANLEFLRIPLSIPEMTIPYFQIKIPEVKEFPLWEKAGFQTLLSTPQQSFDMNLKLHYYKNPDTHSFELYLEPIYDTISNKATILQAQFEEFRDKIVAFLKDSYNQARSRYIKHKIDISSLPPRIFRVPGYKIPILDIQVSSFRAEMPAFSYLIPKEVITPSFKVPALGFPVPSYTLVLPSLTFSVIQIPETLSEITLPTFRLPAIQNNIVIPAMGNTTFDFSFKSTVITLSASAGLHNQSDIVAHFGASSVSVFDILNVKIDGTSSLTRTRGIKVASAVSLEHDNVNTNHECAVSLTKRGMEASVANTAKVNLPFLNVELNQELLGNTKTKPNVSFKKKCKYFFSIPLIEAAGNFDMNWELEALSSYVSLETSTQGKTDIMMMDSCNFAGDLENKASFYLSANSLRSTVKTVLNSNLDKQEKQKRSSNNIFLFDLNKDLALEVSLQRIFAAAEYTSTNNIDFASFTTNGKYIAKGELDFVPLKTFNIKLNTEASQPSNLGDARLIQSIELAISSEKQSLTWRGKGQLASLIHACDLLLSSDESEVRLNLVGLVEGPLAFLKSVKLPVYQKTLWDVLRFDQVTSINKLQFLNISSSIVYTKSMDGHYYAIPFEFLENGVTFSIPEISIAVPSWVKKIPSSIMNVNMRLENPDVPDQLTLPPMISVPAFNIPFTSLHVEPFTLDPKNLIIPKVISTKAFEITLPGLPVISVPAYDINTEYLQGKTSFLSFKMPQYEITVSSFTLPKSVTIGGQTISLNDITHQISNFNLPAITIPEQRIEIPARTLHLPSSVFIRTFGALRVSVKVSSPIYGVSATASVENRDSDLLTSLKSSCISTMNFLEYDFSADATMGYNNGVVSLIGKGKLIHNDGNVNWQQVLAQNVRMKRQAPAADSMEPHHTLNVDISSRTFTDVSFRFASRKDGITASVSSPSSGFLGVHFQRRSPSQLYGKLFSRYLSSPERDIEVFTAKVLLRSSQKLVIQTSWNQDFLWEVMEGTKHRVPAMTDAVFKCINKYHTSHFGFDINRGSKKLKNMLSYTIERAYDEVPVSCTTLQHLVQNFADQARDQYQKASDVLISTSVLDALDRLFEKVKHAMKHCKNNVNALLDAISGFLIETQFKVPGSERKCSLMEAVQEVCSLVEKISADIRKMKFTIPGSDVFVNGDELMDNMEYFLVQLREGVIRVLSVLYLTAADSLRIIAEKAENFLTYLKDQNAEIYSQVDAVYAEVQQYSNQHSQESQRCMAEYKDLIKLKIQEAFNTLNMERINDGTNRFISILQVRFNEGLDTSVALLTQASQSTAPYITVSNKKMDIEVPLPFLWKSFSEWPMHLRQ
ncbi:apolipoprotein B-100 [Archocentrus centrarchus]|uniref:apolipoprotein B-100 n=1 Tax=Archocentrus centrarchus TaxID=63155 RepID=UPI0011EA3250|nr:apolipoprotein B-100 [Archocentrus centrarchus]